MSRIAFAWISDRPNLLISCVRAVVAVLGGADGLDDGVEVIQRDLETFEDVGAGLRLLEVELVRRVTTSRRWAMKHWSISLRSITRGRPLSIASMMTPNVLSSCVCL